MTTFREGLERLDKLVWLLDNWETERSNLCFDTNGFDMNYWYFQFNPSCHDDSLKENVTCGTTACAFGSAMLHPWFRERGLGTEEQHLNSSGIAVPNYAGKLAFPAAAEFFNLTTEQAEELFAPGSYPVEDRKSTHAVATKVQKFLESRIEQYMGPFGRIYPENHEPFYISKDDNKHMTRNWIPSEGAAICEVTNILTDKVYIVTAADCGERCTCACTVRLLA